MYVKKQEILENAEKRIFTSFICAYLLNNVYLIAAAITNIFHWNTE